ncbi:unnamed protein product, partial [Polarella glacialis]
APAASLPKLVSSQKSKQLSPSRGDPQLVRILDLPPEWAGFDAQQLCSTYGKVLELTLVSKLSVGSSGVFDVRFADAAAAAEAAKALNGLQVPARNGLKTIRCLYLDGLRPRRSKWETAGEAAFAKSTEEPSGGAASGADASGAEEQPQEELVEPEQVEQGDPTPCDEANAPWQRHRRKRTAKGAAKSAWSEEQLQQVRSEITARLGAIGNWKPGERTQKKLAAIGDKIVADVTGASTEDAKERMVAMFAWLAKTLGKERAQEFSRWLAQRLHQFQLSQAKQEPGPSGGGGTWPGSSEYQEQGATVNSPTEPDETAGGEGTVSDMLWGEEEEAHGAERPDASGSGGPHAWSTDASSGLAGAHSGESLGVAAGVSTGPAFAKSTSGFQPPRSLAALLQNQARPPGAAAVLTSTQAAFSRMAQQRLDSQAQQQQQQQPQYQQGTEQHPQEGLGSPQQPKSVFNMQSPQLHQLMHKEASTVEPEAQ